MIGWLKTIDSRSNLLIASSLICASKEAPWLKSVNNCPIIVTADWKSNVIGWQVDVFSAGASFSMIRKSVLGCESMYVAKSSGVVIGCVNFTSPKSCGNRFEHDVIHDELNWVSMEVIYIFKVS